MKGFLSKIFRKTEPDKKTWDVAEAEEPEDQAKPAATTRKQPSYKEQVKEQLGIDLPSADTDKMQMGKEFEKQGELEKACACYEGCVRNRFSGNGPYDRLIIIYRKMDRPKDAKRVIKRAISIFERVVAEGHRSDGQKKLEMYKVKLEQFGDA